MAENMEQALKNAETGDPDKKSAIEHVDLHNEAALALALSSERVASARATLELRETQLQATLAAVQNEYGENGKFRVVELNVDKRKVGRVRVEEPE